MRPFPEALLFVRSFCARCSGRPARTKHQIGQGGNFDLKPEASLAQLVEHALRKRMVMG